MNLVQCMFAAALTMAVVWTAYGLLDRWNAAGLKESFSDPPIDMEAAIKKIQLQTPTDSDAIQAHKTILRYTQANANKGIAIVANLTEQFYGPGLTIRKDLDPATLLANYTNPLQGP
jgi:hypothetical protein